MNAVLITGANRGIGLELTQCYLAEGREVFACCRQPQQAEALQAIAAADPRLHIEQVDVGDADSVRALKRRLGNQALDILINNAGVAGPYLDQEPSDDLEIEQWMETLRINTVAPMHVLRQFRANLAAGKNAKAVTVTSQMGAISFALPNTMYAYCASKAGLNKIMRMLADEFRTDGIAVHLVHPGWVRTDMGGADAAIDAKESAAGIVTVINKATLDGATSFMQWNGEAHAW